MDIKIVDAKGNEKENSVTAIAQPPSSNGAIPGEFEMKAIGQVLGLETESQLNKYSDSLHTLLEYAKAQSPDNSPESLKWTIRSLKANMGTPPFGEDNIKFLSRYCYLLNEEKRIKNEKQKFERI